MWELLILIPSGVALVVGIRAVVQNGLTSRRFHVNPELPAPVPGKLSLGIVYQPAIEAPKQKIPQDIQEELDQTPAWWDKQFHKALTSSGAPVEVKELGEIIIDTYQGHQRTYHGKDRVVVADCTCGECKRNAMLDKLRMSR